MNDANHKSKMAMVGAYALGAVFLAGLGLCVLLAMAM